MGGAYIRGRGSLISEIKKNVLKRASAVLIEIRFLFKNVIIKQYLALFSDAIKQTGALFFVYM